MIIIYQPVRNSPAAGTKFEVGGGAELAAAAEEEFIIFIDLTVKGFLRSIIHIGTELTVHHVGKRVPLKLQKVVAWCSRSLSD